MIREFKTSDLDAVMRIWVEVNIEAHSFIDSAYWKSNYASVREEIPQATVFVAEEDKTVIGFIGLAENFIAGIFVMKPFRSRGVGKQLLQKAKELTPELTLEVFAENAQAIAFYQREGFSEIETHINPAVNQVEKTMRFVKDCFTLKSTFS